MVSMLVGDINAIAVERTLEEIKRQNPDIKTDVEIQISWETLRELLKLQGLQFSKTMRENRLVLIEDAETELRNQ